MILLFFSCNCIVLSAGFEKFLLGFVGRGLWTELRSPRVGSVEKPQYRVWGRRPTEAEPFFICETYFEYNMQLYVLGIFFGLQ